MTVKKVWITSHDGVDLVSLTLESEQPLELSKISVRELTFPAKERDRHTINLGLFDRDDLFKIYKTIEQYLFDME